MNLLGVSTKLVSTRTFWRSFRAVFIPYQILVFDLQTSGTNRGWFNTCDVYMMKHIKSINFMIKPNGTIDEHSRTATTLGGFRLIRDIALVKSLSTAKTKKKAKQNMKNGLKLVHLMWWLIAVDVFSHETNLSYRSRFAIVASDNWERWYTGLNRN